MGGGYSPALNSNSTGAVPPSGLIPAGTWPAASVIWAVTGTVCRQLMPGDAGTRFTCSTRVPRAPWVDTAPKLHEQGAGAAGRVAPARPAPKPIGAATRTATARTLAG